MSAVSTALVCRSQLVRLLQLILVLRSGRTLNARELARHCEVSRRTIHRDLSTLESAGVPVTYRRDRQGYQLAPGFMFDPPQLEDQEVIALLVLTQRCLGPEPYDLGRPARQAMSKLLEALDEPRRRCAQALVEAFDLPEPPGEGVQFERREVYEAILLALARLKQIRIWYLEPDTEFIWSTKFSPYRLAFDRATWCLIGRSSLHRDVRTLRVPRIRRVVLTDDPYKIPPRFNLSRHREQSQNARGFEPSQRVWLRFSSRIAPEIHEVVWHPSQSIETRDDGTLDLHLTLNGVEPFLCWILAYGDQVEVLAPPHLREMVREIARRVAQLHGPPSLTITQPVDPATLAVGS